VSEQQENKTETAKTIPEQLPILPLEHFVLFPFMIAPIIVGDEKSKRLVDEALGGQRIVGIFTKKPEAENLTEFDSLYSIGTAANILKMLKMPDGTLRLLLHGIQRVQIESTISSEPFLQARIKPLEETPATGKEVEALIKSIHAQLSRAIELASLPEDLGMAAFNLTDNGKVADLIASNLSLKVPEQQSVLEITDVQQRLERVLTILNREIEVLEIGSKIQSQVKNEIDKNQRDYLLREQMKAIRRELGEEEGNSRELDELRERLEKKALPDYARETAQRELQRLHSMQQASAEYTVSRTYLDWILDLPWLESTNDSLSVPKAKEILDHDHYDLEKIKERILEYLSVRTLKNDMKGPILCFVGPPGVGKTSLGRSIARAMNRKFYRISLGGMRDEAEIRGHRRTYIGAMPGRLIKGLKQVASNNPVIMLDEVDKIGADYRGDPSSALLEVLDPEQNNTFTDHYLDMPFDLSNVMFITTANMLDPIPGPLRDRMEIISLVGYTPREKLMIARKYIIPKQMAENGIARKNIAITDSAVTRIIEDYTREAGLRNLEREIGSVCRKVARMVAEGRKKSYSVTGRNIPVLLGPPRFYSEMAQRMGVPGVAVGLAWTPVGGEILFIEASSTEGNGRFTLTGQLGDVMKESAHAALTFLHSSAKSLHIPEEQFAKQDVHVHVPAGAIPKDGPSAGTTICTALASLLTGRLVKDMLAMTGEISLKGNVLPVGGIKEKLLAAARAGIREIILPERNERDLEQLPEEIRKKLNIHLVTHMSQVLRLALRESASRKTNERGATQIKSQGRIKRSAAVPARASASSSSNGKRKK
jgi:ATP-dependent Lon protease